MQEIGIGLWGVATLGVFAGLGLTLRWLWIGATADIARLRGFFARR